MRRTIVLLTALFCSLPLAGCTPAEPKDVPKYAQGVLDKLKDRRYDALYDDASSGFKGANDKDAFVKKMKDLEGFGQLLEATPGGEPAVSEKDGKKVAVATYNTKFTLAEGPFEVTLLGNDISGEWDLDFYKYDISATTFDPPYAPTQDGADRLARRFLYLWQNRRYDDIQKAMQLEEDPEKSQSFFKRLENAGQLLTMDRTRYEPSSKGRSKAAAMEYSLKFDNGEGKMNFGLIESRGEWRIENVQYDIEYKTSGAPATTK